MKFQERYKDFLMHYGVKGMQWGKLGRRQRLAVQQDRVANAMSKQETNYKKAMLGDVDTATTKKTDAIAKLMSLGNKDAEKTFRTTLNSATTDMKSREIADKATSQKKSVSNSISEMAREQMKSVKRAKQAALDPKAQADAQSDRMSSQLSQYIREREARRRKSK